MFSTLATHTGLFSKRGAWLLFVLCYLSSQVIGAQWLSPSPSSLPVLHYTGRYAYAPQEMPLPVHRAVDAANRLQGKPYVWGGGHRYLNDRGYDCSGSVSYVLHQAGLVSGPRTSKDFQQYGDPGPGRFITIYAMGGHVFMSVCGLRFDTSDFGSGRGDGPRWRPTARSYRGYTMRHPRGL